MRADGAMARVVAGSVLAMIALVAALASWAAPHGARETFRDHPYSPPTRVRVFDDDGRLRAPFFYPQALTDRLEGRYEERRQEPVTLEWFGRGRLVQEPEGAPPFLAAGADRSGRDVFARLVWGARASLGVGLAAVSLAAIIGLLVGGVAGAHGGWLDAVVMRLADVAAVLPAIYVVVVLRSALPLVLPATTTVALLIVILGVVASPWVARGVRAIVAAERAAAHVEAARALGASGWRVLTRHLLPSTRGYVLTQMLVLFPALVVAEATLSFVGLGLPDTVPSWGTALQEAANITAIEYYPWLLLPALALFVVTWCVNTLIAETPYSQARRP